ncbi:hypothetical protein FOA52_008241 [Chlamydomonas sp. UWO 241]|nr:hypothetical protein FOA52_008241 [Chlamydomonas sp. UWO 241]
MPTSEPLEIVGDIEAYLSKHALDAIVKEMMVEILKTRPEEPHGWMTKYLVTRSDGSGGDDCAVASTQDKDAFVAVCSTDADTQQYLVQNKVHVALLELLKQVVDAKPDNVLSFLATAAHNLRKNPPEGME